MYRFYMDAFELEQGALKNAFKTRRILKVLLFGCKFTKNENRYNFIDLT